MDTPPKPKRTDGYVHRTGDDAAIFPLQQTRQRKRGLPAPFSSQVFGFSYLVAVTHCVPRVVADYDHQTGEGPGFFPFGGNFQARVASARSAAALADPARSRARVTRGSEVVVPRLTSTSVAAARAAP
jgi:hypothetical protein